MLGGAWSNSARTSTTGSRVIVGLPLMVDGQLFNAAAVIHAGKILGIVPKTYLPNYKEFYDARYFLPGTTTPCHLHSAPTIAGVT